jgi:hypothetical protein
MRIIELALLVTALSGKSAIGLYRRDQAHGRHAGGVDHEAALAAALGLVHGAVCHAAVRRPADLGVLHRAFAGITAGDVG